MFTACWSVKGGTGTTVVAATLALSIARLERRVVAADLAGDLPAALGVPEPAGPGLVDWLAAGRGVPDDALGRLVVPVSECLAIIGRGGSALSDNPPGRQADAEAGGRLGDALRAVAGAADLVVDCGRADTAAGAAVVEGADRSLLVLRPCYLALRRAVAAPRPSAVALVCEPERSLGVADVEDVLGVPVIFEIAWDPAVSRAVDAGLMATRLPRRLRHAIRGVPT